MRIYTAVVISWAAISFGISSANDSESVDGFIDHAGDWLVGITKGGIEVAKDIARKEKFNSVEEIPELKIYRLYNLDSKDKRHKDEITEKLQSYDAVHVAQPNTKKAYLDNDWPRRVLPSSGYFVPKDDRDNIPGFPQLFGGQSHFTDALNHGDGRLIGYQIIKPDLNAIYCAGQSIAVSTKREFYCKDPLSRKQWFLRSCEEILKGKPSPHGLKLIQTWEDFKVSGKGVVVVVADSGVRTDHSDLDVDLTFSYDFVKGNNDPTPGKNGNPHGTNCAGVIAMKRDNGICGTGVAPGVTLGGIRLANPAATFHEIKANIFKAKDVHIVVQARGSNFSDTFKELQVFRESALKYGVEKGRNGKGIIYVAAAGNHKKEGKLCSIDAMLNNLYVITIGGVQHDGTPSTYAERCANMFAVTYSGNGPPYTILTVTLGARDQCKDDFNGTSASSPLAGGLLALVLEANPNLTWRDVKHLLAWTSEIAGLKPAGGFIKNARGLYPSLDFGFGLIQVYDMVEQARNFKNVPPMHTCVIRHRVREDRQRWNGRSGLAIEFDTKSCDNTPQQVTYVEEVEARISLTFAVRGMLQIHLTSPKGTKVPLLEARQIDRQPADFTFTFRSVFTWGETATGKWILEFSDASRDYNNRGTVEFVDFVIFGTKDEPEHYKKGNRRYFGLPDEL